MLHGHISESGPIVSGALSPDTINAVVQNAISDLVVGITAGPERYHGPMVLRFTVLPSGAVSDAVILVDRVARGDEMEKGTEVVATGVVRALMQLSFPPAPASSQVTLPIILEARSLRCVSRRAGRLMCANDNSPTISGCCSALLLYLFVCLHHVSCPEKLLIASIGPL